MRRGSGDSRKFYGSRTIVPYPAEKVYEEAAFLGYYLHWGRQEILELPHLERQRWCREVSGINTRLNAEEQPKNIFDL